MQASGPNARWTWEPAKGRQGSEKGAPGPCTSLPWGPKGQKGLGRQSPAGHPGPEAGAATKPQLSRATFTGDHRAAPVQNHQACCRATAHAAWRLELTTSSFLHSSRARTRSCSASPGGCHWRPRVCCKASLRPRRSRRFLPVLATTGDQPRPPSARRLPAWPHAPTPRPGSASPTGSGIQQDLALRQTAPRGEKHP